MKKEFRNLQTEATAQFALVARCESLSNSMAPSWATAQKRIRPQP